LRTSAINPTGAGKAKWSIPQFREKWHNVVHLGLCPWRSLVYKTLSFIFILAGFVSFCGMTSAYFSGNAEVGPSQTMEFGLPTSPWLSFRCSSFSEPSPDGCDAWNAELNWKSFSWIGLGLFGAGIWFGRKGKSKDRASNVYV
jgi:hypothetical protein